LTRHDAASVRMKLKVTGTQRHNLERAARASWPAISQNSVPLWTAYLQTAPCFWNVRLRLSRCRYWHFL